MLNSILFSFIILINSADWIGKKRRDRGGEIIQNILKLFQEYGQISIIMHDIKG